MRNSLVRMILLAATSGASALSAGAALDSEPARIRFEPWRAEWVAEVDGEWRRPEQGVLDVRPGLHRVRILGWGILPATRWCYAAPGLTASAGLRPAPRPVWWSAWPSLVVPGSGQALQGRGGSAIVFATLAATLVVGAVLERRIADSAYDEYLRLPADASPERQSRLVSRVRRADAAANALAWTALAAWVVNALDSTLRCPRLPAPEATEPPSPSEPRAVSPAPATKRPWVVP